MSGYPDSLLHRKLRGRMADWDLNAMLSRQILFAIQGGNWQRGGGKGSKPKPIPLPDGKGRGDQPAKAKASGAEIAQRLKNLGLIPPSGDDPPPMAPPAPSAAEFAERADDMWLDRQQRLVDE